MKYLEVFKVMNSVNKTMEEIKDYKCMVCGGKVEYCFEARESNVQRFTCSKCNIVYNLWGLQLLKKI